MASYEIQVPDGEERGIRVGCPEHDQYEEFQPGYSTVVFTCGPCGREVEISLHDLHDWRDLGERC